MATETLSAGNARFSGLTIPTDVWMTAPAANDSPFEPLVVSDPAFMAWGLRVALRLRNKAPGASDYAIERAITMDGIPSLEWAEALDFMMTLAQINKRNAEWAVATRTP